MKVTNYLSKPPSLVHSGTAQIGKRLWLNHSCLCVHCRHLCSVRWGSMTSDGPGHPTLRNCSVLLYWPVRGTPCELCVSRRALRLVPSRASMDNPGKRRLSLLIPHLYQKEKGRGTFAGWIYYVLGEWQSSRTIGNHFRLGAHRRLKKMVPSEELLPTWKDLGNTQTFCSWESF